MSRDGCKGFAHRHASETCAFLRWDIGSPSLWRCLSQGFAVAEHFLLGVLTSIRKEF